MKEKKRKWDEYFDEIFDELVEEVEKMFDEVEWDKPFIYGFSLTRKGEKPELREFGNIRREGREIKVEEEERKPLTDVVETDSELVVIAELPGVEEKDIKVVSTPFRLKISAKSRERNYKEELVLPAKVGSISRKTYRNGVLEVRLRKA
jgi:HSP20 family protein